MDNKNFRTPSVPLGARRKLLFTARGDTPDADAAIGKTFVVTGIAVAQDHLALAVAGKDFMYVYSLDEADNLEGDGIEMTEVSLLASTVPVD